MKNQRRELLLQTLETAMGGVVIYSRALKCVCNEDLRTAWTGYLDQAGRHIEIIYELFDELGLDTEEQTPGRLVVRHLDQSLVSAMELARFTESTEAAELFACECVALAETKDQTNWQLLSEIATQENGREASAIRKACGQVHDEGDDLYHTQGWCRELWIASLGMEATLPPPEERSAVIAIGGAHRSSLGGEGMLSR